MSLRETATGYAQAFHALAAARGRAERRASFAASPDLALTIGPRCGGVGQGIPLTDPYPPRETGTGPRRCRTAGHRRVMAQLPLPCDGPPEDSPQHPDRAPDMHPRTARPGPSSARRPSRTGTRSAQRHRTDPAPAGERHRTGCTNAAHPGRAPVTARRREWAQQQFRPVTAPDVPACIAETLTTWLRLDARIGPTAAALSISTSAVRKRLTRGEALLTRSLLRSPAPSMTCGSHYAPSTWPSRRDCKKNGPVSHSVVTERCQGR